MNAVKYAEALEIITTQSGSPVKVKFENRLALCEPKIFLIEANAGVIRQLIEKGYSLFLTNGEIEIDHFNVA